MFQEKLSRVQLLKRQRDHPGQDQETNVNNTANLSMLRHLTNPSMLPVSGIMDWQHQSMSPGPTALPLPNFFQFFIPVIIPSFAH